MHLFSRDVFPAIHACCDEREVFLAMLGMMNVPVWVVSAALTQSVVQDLYCLLFQNKSLVPWKA